MTNSNVISAAAPVVPQLYRLLRRRVLVGDLRPGKRLSESEVAQVYGTSRQPVREAFIRMAADGLVEIRPQRGSYIRRISLREVLAARMIREAVEVELLRLAIEQAKPGLGQDLLARIAGQEHAVAQGDTDEFVRLDDEFHMMLAEGAGQRPVWDEMEGLKSQLNRLRHLSARQFDPLVLIEDHRVIAQAVLAADAGAAQAAMQAHLRRVLDELPVIQRAQPDYFID